MGQGHVDFESNERAQRATVRAFFAGEFDGQQALAKAELVGLERGALQVTASGWFCEHAATMAFDRHWYAGCARAQFSRIIPGWTSPSSSAP